MITKEQIDAMDIDDSQIQAELDDYEDMTLLQLIKIIQKYNNKMEKIKNRLDKTDTKKNFDYSVMYEDIKTYSIKYSPYDADKGVRKKFVSTIEEHLKPAIDHLQLLRQKAFEVNRVKQLEYLKRKVTCDCGMEVAYVHLVRHKLSKQHIKKLIQTDEEDIEL